MLDTGAERVKEIWAITDPWREYEYCKGITDTLNALGITIPGINIPDKQSEELPDPHIGEDLYDQ